MEAVKRLPMISFELKNSPEPTSFHNLKQCIAEYYHEDPESYSKEFRELEQLRGLACRPRVDFECVATVKRYYSQLHSLQNRFPLSSENELLDFAWKDLYSGSLIRSSNIKYEMASILYNIAALHSQLGIEEDRSDPESMKIACTHFQCAAWAFGEVKNLYPNVTRGDLTPELMIFMQQICFAQAQECILEKSLADNRKPAIIAKVTAQVISFYTAALSATFGQVEDGTVQDLVGNKFHKEWLRYIKFKSSYLSSILFLYQGMNSEEQRKMGERVALYNAACEKLEAAKKESKGMNRIDEINEALVLMTDIVEGKRKNAKQENEFIYHESIPEISSISAVQGANLVQGIPFDVADPQVIGDDIFKRLVPMKTHEHLSVYSEEKANILRSLGAKIDDRDAELASFMGSLNIDSLNAMGASQEKLPQGLVDRCAELSAKPNAISDLVDSMSSLADICCDVEVTLKEIKKILDDESKQEQEYQKQMGKRPTGHMTELTREFTKYFEAHNKAGESNDTLRKAMELHVSNLKILGQPLSSLRSQIPQADPIDDVTRKELTTLLNKVEEMKKQRDGIFNELREQILNQDDITAQLITHGDKDVDELFKKELKKYSQSVSIIEQNLVAQGNILKALTDTYAKHAMTLKSYNDTKAKREQFYSSLIASFDVYEDLMLKSSKGLDFYKKLQGNVQKLLSRVKAARDVQEEERQQILKNSQPKAPPIETIKPVDITYKPSDLTYKMPTGSGSGGPKLKDYLKSGMVPGMGGLRDELNKLPAVRPSPVGQENIPTSNPASCPSMNYNYRNPQDNSYSPAAPYYPATDQHSTHSGSLSSSTTSLNNDFYNQGQNFVNQGYVNPIYQTTNLQDLGGYKPVDRNNYQPSNYTGMSSGTACYSSFKIESVNPTDYYRNNGSPAVPDTTAQYQTYNPYPQAPTAQQTPAPLDQQNAYQYQNYQNVQQFQYPGSAASPSLGNQQYPGGNNQSPYTATGQSQNQYPPAAQSPSVNSQQYPAAAPSPSMNQQYPTTASPSLNNQLTQQYQAQSYQQPGSQQYTQQIGSQGYQQSGSQQVQQPGSQQFGTQQLQQPGSQQLQQPGSQQLQQPGSQQVGLQQLQQPGSQQLQQPGSQQLQQPGSQQPGSQQLQQPGPQQLQQPGSQQPGSQQLQQPGSQQLQQPGSQQLQQPGSQQLGSQQFQQPGSQQLQQPGSQQSQQPGSQQLQQPGSQQVQQPGSQQVLNSGTQQPGSQQYTQYQNQSTIPQSPISSDQYSSQGFVQPSATDYNNQNYYAMNQSQNYMINPYAQYGEQSSQQNYSCYTPTVNAGSSYMTAGDVSSANTTQSVNYSQVPEVIDAVTSHVTPQKPLDSPLRQPNAIPTYTSAVNAMSMTHSNTNSTQSQQQVVSTTVDPGMRDPVDPVVPVKRDPVDPVKKDPAKSANIDLLSDIDFTLGNSTIDNIPTLMPMSATKAVESPQKILIPQSPVVAAPVKLNDDLADLDFNSLSVKNTPVKTLEPEKPKKVEDPFEDPTVLKQFHKEVESLEKFMETLTVKTLNGVTPLANKWKELQDLLVKDESKRSVSVARLFPDKNRSVDCLPYDHARVSLPTSTDNYINAVLVKDCGPVSFILTQTPMPNTVNDYWEMVWSQKSNTLACLHSANELLDPFWPQTIGEERNYGEISVVLTKQFDFSHSQENKLKVSKHGLKITLDVSLLQIKGWKKSSADQVLDVAGNIITSFKQQNHEEKQQNLPIILNCISGGAERSGLVTLGISSIFATQMRKPTLLNVVDHWFRICSQRKGALEDEIFIQLSLEIVLNNAHRILNKRGIMTSYQMKNAEKLTAAVETEKSVKDTGLDSLDPFWKFK